MKQDKKIRVAVVCGGRSGEHQISLQSGASVLRNLDPNLFETIPIVIDLQGRWHIVSASALLQQGTSPPLEDASVVMLSPSPKDNEKGAELIPYHPNDSMREKTFLPRIDVVFPVVHGTLCEDGTLQGLLELAEVPYVGCGVLASAVAMDKEMAKRLLKEVGLPVVPFLVARKSKWKQGLLHLQQRVQQDLGYPCFVKPANSGSSVGVHKVKSPQDLQAALENAFLYDHKVLLEKAIPARELEVAVLEDMDPAQPAQTSIVGEIVPRHEFYSYEAKYLDKQGADLLIPAVLSEEQSVQVRDLAVQAFAALECQGMARMDFFMDRDTGAVYFNEANTIPGFTSISMYPKLWEATGLSYANLLTHLVQLALQRHQRKQTLVREFHHG